MNVQSVAMIHYSAPPVIGGVEAVIKAHLKEFMRAGYSCTVIAGRGDIDALPPGANFIGIPEIDSQHDDIIQVSSVLETGIIPDNYESIQNQMVHQLGPILSEFDHLIIHNIFTKHFNLPLTAALHQLLDEGEIHNVIAWCHDFTWTSPSSRSKVFPGYPWDLLRTKRPDCVYAAVSRERQQTLAELFGCPVDEIKLVYNGVDAFDLLGLSEVGWKLVNDLGLLNSDINLLMPVRVTKAKNIEFAMEVVSALKSKGLAPRLVITGPPDPHDASSMNYFQDLKALRKILGIRNELRFVFESGPGDEPYYIDEKVVGDLYRVCDVMFMPSHHEGFGMPVLEAGLVGIPVVSRAVPAAQELALEEASFFNQDADANHVAMLLIQLLERSPTARLRRQVRKRYTWQAIFDESIQPLLHSGIEN